ncbi:MAG: isoaspartyl peptidase/L-asparaginase [Bacteroidota bacterium]|nr:isoaspartyl peptidase/L-asparaginase [Bacteroidota bacterium]
MEGSKISIAIHGGAGTIARSKMTAEKEQLYTSSLEHALNAGYDILEKGGSALDAVEQAVISLEDCDLFNAGKGCVFNSKGTHELDASIMDGSNRKAGAVAGIYCIKNPISLSRQIMEKTEHVFMMGEGAMEFADAIGIQRVDQDYFYNEDRHKQWLSIRDSEKFQLDHSKEKRKKKIVGEKEDTDKKFGTVGAVAVDKQGNLAAATSTGGMTNKKYGRVGDSPIIGAGTYAYNKTCAVSCTGNGEFFIRGVVAYDVSCLMEYQGLSLQEACDEVIFNRLKEIGGEGGLIAVDARGNVAMPFNSSGMYRGSRSSDGDVVIRIFK